ncbi:MAG: DUF4383 domain-containing protein [Acidobacteriota bacterium]
MTMSKMARIFGYTFLLLGIFGFIPGITYNGHLFGIFHVNWVHNFIHLLSGAVFLWAAYRSECASMKCFQVFTFVYGLVTLLGLLFINRMMLGPMAINFADTLLHAAITGVSLYMGYLASIRRTVYCGV